MKVKRSIIVVTIAIFLVISTVVGVSCAPQDALDIFVAELDNGVVIENLGSVDCRAFVNSPEGEQQFELGVG